MKLLNKQFLLKQAGIHFNKLPRKSFARLWAATKAFLAKIGSNDAAKEAIKDEEVNFDPANRSRGNFSDNFHPYNVLSASDEFRGADYRLPSYVGVRDIVQANRGKLSDGELKDLATTWFQQHSNPSEWTTFNDYAKKSWGDINYDPSNAVYNARGVDALQFFLGRGVNPKQRQYVQNMPLDVTLDTSDAFSNKWSRITLAPKKDWDPAILGHELGHAVDYTRRRPAQLNNTEVTLFRDLAEYAPSGITGFTDNVQQNTLPFIINNPHSSELMTMVNEINANHQFMKSMRSSLQDNRPLYNRYRRYATRLLLPYLATYVGGNEKEFNAAIPALPKQLQRRAVAYMNLYDRHKARAYDYVKNNGGFSDIPEQKPGERDVAVLSRYAKSLQANGIKRDPRIYDDLYNYAVQSGMSPNPNAWYNTPIGENTRPIDFIINWAPPVNPNVEGLRANYGNPNKAVGAESTSLSNAAQSSY